MGLEDMKNKVADVASKAADHVKDTAHKAAEGVKSAVEGASEQLQHQGQKVHDKISDITK